MTCDDCGREAFRRADGRIDYGDKFHTLFSDPPKKSLADWFDPAKQMRFLGNRCWQCQVTHDESRLIAACEAAQ